VSEMTYASPLSCSVLMSKFMRRSPESFAGRLAGRSGVSLSARPKPQSSTSYPPLPELTDGAP
jgi:hypothetical protein